MLQFLHYPCICSNYKQRRFVEFFQHVVDLYNSQEGRCAITGQPLKRPLGKPCCDPRFFASIDRIRNDKGYEIGNVRLTLQWVNHALGKRIKTQEIIEFASLLCFEKVMRDQEYLSAKYLDRKGYLSTHGLC